MSVAAVFAVLLLAAFGNVAESCTTIGVGKKATVDGSTMGKIGSQIPFLSFDRHGQV
jgi:hypothetical protein